MRASEWIDIVAFSFFVVLGWSGMLTGGRRTRVTAMGIAGLTATAIGASWVPLLLSPLAASVVRDWLPASLLLLVYHQAGQFFVRIDRRFQDRLEQIDRRIVAPLLRRVSHWPAPDWFASGFEVAYLLCYLMIPAGLGMLYLLRLRRHADHYWVVVLVSAYVSYGVLPFLQTLPPRKLAEPWLIPLPPTRARSLNLRILGHASIQANTFPSAHVAASTGVALVLAVVASWPIGLVFVTLAAAIAAGTIAGRYHFASDVIAGGAVATIVFMIARWSGSW
jgi:membrane-associated phospholipid phosphatase